MRADRLLVASTSDAIPRHPSRTGGPLPGTAANTLNDDDAGALPTDSSRRKRLAASGPVTDSPLWGAPMTEVAGSLTAYCGHLPEKASFEANATKNCANKPDCHAHQVWAYEVQPQGRNQYNVLSA
jgi:hypothetical protein